MKPVTITELNNQLKSLVDTHFEIVYVKGEVSKVTYHTSGHLYFTLKDENSSINCAMWRSNVKGMKSPLRVGDEVEVFGGVSVYVPRGEYKLIAQKITFGGIGELQIAFERLKEELKNLGYFDNKKPLPQFPKRVALITSKTGAALQDMLRVAKKRWLLSKFYLFDTLVQGDGAKESIAKNIKKADEFRFEDGRGFDLIIVARGGGSKEDLWAFNERVVADAIFEAKTPIISAVGHEIDYLISDFVADKRAATPSNAIEIALPDKNELLLRIDEMISSFNLAFLNILHRKEFMLNGVKDGFRRVFERFSFYQKEIENLKGLFDKEFEEILTGKGREIESLVREFEKIMQNKISFINSEFDNAIAQILNFKYNNVNLLLNSFEMLNPKKRGCIEIIKNNKKVKLKELEIGDEIVLRDLEFRVRVKVLNKEME